MTSSSTSTPAGNDTVFPPVIMCSFLTSAYTPTHQRLEYFHLHKSVVSAKAPGTNLALVLAISVDCNCVRRPVKTHGERSHPLCSDNLENEEYLHDNSVRLTLPLKYGVNINMHGWVYNLYYCFLPQNRLFLWCTTANISDMLFSPPSISHISAFCLAGLWLPTRLCLGMKKRLL